MSHVYIADRVSFCQACNQYGCHLFGCPNIRRFDNIRWLPADQHADHLPYGPEECPEAELREEIAKLKVTHAAEVARLLRRLSLMEDLVTKTPLEPVGGPVYDKEKKQVSCPNCHAVLYNVKTATPRIRFDPEEWS